MTEVFKVPDEYQEKFRRLMPYMALPLQKDPRVFESLLVYLKLGGERLARVVIDAYNANQRQAEAEALRQLREASFFEEQSDVAEDAEDAEDGDDDEKEEKDDEADSVEKD